jgi:hypothetical protein
VEKYCWTRQATDENMAHAQCIRLETHIQNMQYLLLCHGGGYKNSPQYYVIRTLHVLLTLERKRCGFSIRPTPLFYATPRDVRMCDRSNTHYLSCADSGMRRDCVVKEI